MFGLLQKKIHGKYMKGVSENDVVCDLQKL